MHENSRRSRLHIPAVGDRPLVVAIVAAACVATLLGAGTPAQAAAGYGASTSTPNNDLLSGIATVSATDAWAVGAAGFNGINSQQYTGLILRWNGKSWTTAATPNYGGTGADSGTRLNGVSAVSATHAWAVGDYYSDANGENQQALVLRWNGTTWAQVPVPQLTNSTLTAVSAVSATDAWAVGYYYTSVSGQPQTLTLHWNGTSWTQVASPDPTGSGASAQLSGVSALSASNAWAVGTSYPGTGISTKTMLLHWNGTSWTQQVAKINRSGAQLNGVTASATSGVWAVGWSSTDVQTSYLHSLILHSDGTSWTQDLAPSPGGTTGQDQTNLTAVSSISPKQAWAVGSYQNDASSLDGTVTLRWNGTKWAQVPSPSPGGTNRFDSQNDLTGVSGRTTSDAWAVGYYTKDLGLPLKTVILHWNGTSWKQVTSPN